MLALSRGQQLALDQLVDIASHSNGALEILGSPGQAKPASYISIKVSLETKSYRTKYGLQFRDRETIYLYIPQEFPLKKPDLHFTHNRFIGTPHVQWGHVVCLYQSVDTEYDPSDGMFGFLNRIDQWMQAAGNGSLDPVDAPLHPPVAYSSSDTIFVARADTPTDLSNDEIWLGRAEMRLVRESRLDIIGWTKLENWGETKSENPVAAAVFFNKPLATEFPTQVNQLFKLIEGAGLPFSLLINLLKLLSLIVPEGNPAYFVLGAPMRRKAAGDPIKPHLTVWEIHPETVKILRAEMLSLGADEIAREQLINWIVGAEVRWCTLLEDRPEIVHRRDGGTLLSGIAGKRVLLLGCGALGSTAGEMILRSNAASLHLVDNGIVKPGILIRQRYSDSDIGLHKATALHKHLEAIGLSCIVTSEVHNLVNQAQSHFDLKEWDLIVDATASVRVTHRIETELKEHNLAIPMLSISVSASAENGSVLVKMPQYVGGPHFITRQAKLEAFAKYNNHNLIKAFWPSRDTIKVFQPEPGCSEPTFIGSAADIDHFAAGLINVGLSRIATLDSDQASLDLIASPWIGVKANEYHHLTFQLKNYAQFIEQRHKYDVRRSEVAALDMCAELNRISRTRSDQIETGGLIFGEIDDGHQVIWIDSLSGPPPDSTANETQFMCGTAGTKEINDYKSTKSGKSSRFIGIWHTHPISRGRPSQDDLIAMASLLHFQQFPPRQVVMLIVGYAATKREENYYLYRRNEFVLIASKEESIENQEENEKP